MERQKETTTTPIENQEAIDKLITSTLNSNEKSDEAINGFSSAAKTEEQAAS